MGRNDEDFALLLDGINTVEANLAHGLLEGARIPSLRHGPDFDVAELGRAAHDNLRGTSLFVPREALERAVAVLEAAWGAERVQELRGPAPE